MGSKPDITTDVLNRARGALLGQLAGDALGRTVEFQAAADIATLDPNVVGDGPFRARSGQVTDDGEQALARHGASLGPGATTVYPWIEIPA